MIIFSILDYRLQVLLYSIKKLVRLVSIPLTLVAYGFFVHYFVYVCTLFSYGNKVKRNMTNLTKIYFWGYF